MMRTMSLKFLPMRAALALLFACPVAKADDEIYRCEGKDGVTIFSSKPCGPDAVEIMVAPPPPGPAVSGISIEPAAPTLVPSAPASAPLSVAQKERYARIEADKAAAACNAEVRMLVTRLGEIDRQDYALGNPYASAAQAEGARTRDRQPVVDRLAVVRTECQSRWNAAYQAAKAR